jgi:alpha-beta hydrolase superfamily lysophospholipase
MLRAVAIALLLILIALACAIAFGGPDDPPPMASINDPFRDLDLGDLPPPTRFTARDGASLAYRTYPAAGEQPRGSVVLVHGSSAGSSSMHVMARAFSAAGYAAHALDVRGHGESGARGQIDYVGQLEDDLEDFARSAALAPPATLIGFSSGGGFALRVAGGARRTLFSSYLLLSPFISQDAPTYRPDSGGWVRVGIPRIVALMLLNQAGVRIFNGLPVTRFALSESARATLTPSYSFALAENFRPPADYRACIRAVDRPLRIVAGTDDEAFHADRFAAVFEAEGRPVPVTLVPGVGHIPLTLEPVALQAAVAAVDDLNRTH